MSEDHERGKYINPEDGKTYEHPSSLLSFFHVGPDGKVVFSPAQKAALKELEAREKKLPPAAESQISYDDFIPEREAWPTEKE